MKLGYYKESNQKILYVAHYGFLHLFKNIRKAEGLYAIYLQYSDYAITFRVYSMD
jgi:hypothetical protein